MHGRGQLPKLGHGSLYIFDRVVKQGRYQHRNLGHSSLVREARSQCNRMIDVGRCIGILAALVAVLVRCEGECSEQDLHIFLIRRHEDIV